jgi:RNA polymerase sigma-70 factor (ECF subfamily)
MEKITETYRELALSFKSDKNEKVFNKLYIKIKPGLTSFVFNLTKNPEVTQDIVADTLSKLYTRIDHYDPSYEITTWIYRIAKNEALQWIYQRNRHISMDFFSENGYEPSEGDGEISMGNSGYQSGMDMEFRTKSEKEYLEDEQLIQNKYDICLEALNSLKPKYRQIMVDRFVEKMSYYDIEVKHNTPIIENLGKMEVEKSYLDPESQEYIELNSAIHKLEASLINGQTVKNRINRGRKMMQDILTSHSVFRIRKDI